ncbi:pyridoxal-dependent decarboxylase [Lacinutrix sp. Hel_I_90]|uniref:pyridoxal phosphate-dependent decarboxylase family protein n=1 Tax=Lacinutrix sp. Hel_I_90 TaxID=1249999 RepID=UPI0005CA15B3|nr:pyridoxal-dependent decarboxylase [Lacinutrix sp. Hel_I_90]
MKYWFKKTQEELKTIVFNALNNNANYTTQNILGIPASHLNEDVFPLDAAFLKEAPFMTSLVKNPNHIGCHTLNKSEGYFSGTQEIEKELIALCAVDILKGKPLEHDGYVASGGTEANIQAIWTYRNYFMQEHQATLDEICIVCSEDSHYSMDKSSNLLCISNIKIPNAVEDRSLSKADILAQVTAAKSSGKKYFIVIVNMMTTMFGTVDDIDLYVESLKAVNVDFKIHVDGAFGGFYYPFSNEENTLNFSNKYVTSFTLDAHKMAQAPYGTGVFLIKKGFMKYVNTEEASYVVGQDSTLIGSRSGANAIAVWMILMKMGPFGWFERIHILKQRTHWLCKQLDDLAIAYYHFPTSNIVTIKSAFINAEIAKKFGLVPDNHLNPKWFKIVVMSHVTIEKLMLLIQAFKHGVIPKV